MVDRRRIWRYCIGEKLGLSVKMKEVKEVRLEVVVFKVCVREIWYRSGCEGGIYLKII